MDGASGTMAYQWGESCDGWTIEKNSPDLLVMPKSTEQVSDVLRALHQRIPLQLSRIASPGVAVPAEAREATAKRARHARRQERLHIVESARGRSLARLLIG